MLYFSCMSSLGWRGWVWQCESVGPGLRILKELQQGTWRKVEDGRMGRQSLWPQEAYPLLLLLLFYNELLKPSFPSLPWAEGGAAMGATESRAGFARTSPEGGCFERGGGLDGAGVQCAVCAVKNSPGSRQVRAQPSLHMRARLACAHLWSPPVMCECVFGFGLLCRCGLQSTTCQSC